MTVALLALCLAVASAAPPPAPPTEPLREEGIEPGEGEGDPTAPEPDAAPPGDDTGSPGTEPAPRTAEPTEGDRPADEPTPDDATPPEPTPEATEPPPTPPATLSPTTLPSPGDVEDEPVEDEPLEGEPYDPLRDSPEALQARHWIRTGIALLAVGGTLSATAIVFGAVDPCTKGIGNSCQASAARRAALAIGIPGALMVAGGATSLAIGIVRRNELRASVAVGRSGAMLGVSGRF